MRRFVILVSIVVCLSIPAMNLFARSYTPIQISLVPGVAIPFGISDAAISVGAIGNISGRIDLLQAAGIFNIAGSISGIQAAGIFNITDRVMDGIQLAGIFNIAEGRQAPLQASGIFNIADGVQGIQMGGVFNIADQVEGAQVAGIFNIADDVNGFQVGLINIADRVRGIQVGLLNISSNGVFDLFASWNPETDYVTGTFRSGNTSVFGVYSIMMPQEDLFRDYDRSIVSAGIGTRIGDPRSLFMDLSLSASQSVGPDVARFVDALTFSHGLTPADVFAPWPTLDASLSLKVGGLQLTGGLRSDIFLAAAPNMPSSLARGWVYSDTWFGERFSAYTTWYVGIGF